MSLSFNILNAIAMHAIERTIGNHQNFIIGNSGVFIPYMPDITVGIEIISVIDAKIFITTLRLLDIIDEKASIVPEMMFM